MILPDWPAPRHVRACFSTRVGGVSQGRYAALNLATHVGDDPQSVQQNRARLQAHLPAGPCWLEQVHGATVVDATHAANGARADGAISRQAGVVCAVMTADCLPVLFCTADGRAVGAAHAGWRGLAAGVLENTLTALQAAPTGVMAWLGPAISQTAFEVGTEVREAFVGRLPAAAEAFVATGPGKWHADLYLLARQRLRAAGVSQIFGGGLCTYSDSRRFFSARRDGTQSGRMAGLVWIDA
nr:peptidoglycan editing factor PgeF [Candidatus Dactylopiibacterium carminicum]